ncbi:carbohydrate-binding protein [Corynebacterium tapiri]|uniref:Chitin-binding type-3 domain-containing protein n=1 Tax=Corynebacterium tapiri TaxID=1448266 RepID=A0A5C4U5V0_9CORY|nr:carbohydrate-binding protein [Corynebacterium tapiri]TNL98766.1 hypothetical protein FHE74_03875 [Corynebacterium tapiri]
MGTNIDYQSLTDIELSEVVQKAWAEVKRREAAPFIEEARAEDAVKLWEAHPELKPAVTTKPAPAKPTDSTLEQAAQAFYIPTWTQPTGAHDAHPKGYLCVEDGKIWQALIEAVVWSPTSPGMDERYWQDVTAKYVNAGEKPAEAPSSPAPSAPSNPAWKPGISVKAGDKYTYGGVLYQVIQAHTTQAGWAPPNVPALFQKA